MRLFPVILVALLAPVSAHSETIVKMQNEFAPLVNTRAGRIDSCGLHFSSAVQTVSGKIYGIEGSVMTFFWKDRLPGMVLKVVANEMTPTGLVPRKVHFASMRHGQTDTLPFKPFEGDNPNAFLAGVSMAEQPDLVLTFTDAVFDAPWLSVSVDKDASDISYRLPAFDGKDADTFRQINDCRQKGLDTLQAELGGK